ncbi:hypothetical protein HK098_003002 [Nowakowskiella sp. JEL0407]|nr:hypothetical protein HK098_003002 [Nowakowskiella sp. JEL0407]
MSTREKTMTQLQQLIRELVLAETTTSSPNAITSTSANSEHESPSNSSGTQKQNGSGTLGANQGTMSNENFDQISYTIKQIFQSGRQEAFTEQLSLFISKKELEIEKICNFHFQEFVQSVNQLLKVRAGTEILKNGIINLNKDMQESGLKMVGEKKEIISFRKTQRNIDLALDSIQSCLFVLDIANKVNECIESKKYYSALRLMDELQTVHLRSIAQYEFAKHMKLCIPPMQESIREAVTNDMTDWFVRVREKSKQIGKQAQTIRLNRLEKSSQNKNISRKNNAVTLIDDEEEESEIKIDLKPLYQCLHIHDVLGRRNEFQNNYETNRRLQANLVLKTPFSLQSENLDGFIDFLYEIIGFFVVEAAILNSTDDFRARGNVDALWEATTAKLHQVITENLQECEDADRYLAIKQLVIQFTETLEGYGYNVESLRFLLASLFDRYTQLLSGKCVGQLTEIVENDEYSQYIVANSVEYDYVLAAFTIPDEKRMSIRYPRTLPFSRGFIKICYVIREFVIGFYRFKEGFEQQHNEMDDLVKKSLESILSTIAQLLRAKFMQNNLSQVVQIIVNLEYLELATEQFEKFLDEFRGDRLNSNHQRPRLVLQAVNSFKEESKAAEKRVFELINLKLDQFLELASYDWIAQFPISKPSAYLQDLIEYLKTAVSSTLANLPPSIKSYIYFDALEHLSCQLMEFLINPETKKITPAGMESFSIDLSFVESFVAGIASEANVGEVFTELRQTVNYLTTENFEDYLQPEIKSKKYLKVQNSNIILLLEKMKGDPVGVFSSRLTLAEKTRRAAMEKVLKQLKSKP